MTNAHALMAKIQSLPEDRIIEVEHFVDALKKRISQTAAFENAPLNFPVDYVTPWPEGLSLSRKDMYGDEER